MNKAYLKILILLLVSSASLFSQNRISTEKCTQKHFGHVRHKVTNEPIQNATVLIFSNKILLISTFTDEEGAFLFDSECDKSYIVTATIEGFDTDSKGFTAGTATLGQGHSLRIEEKTDSDTDEAPCEKKIIGIILNPENDRPISQASIFLLKNDRPNNTTTTNSNGKYQFLIDCYDEYQVIISKNGHKNKVFTVTKGTETIIKKTLLYPTDFTCKQLFTGTIIDFNTASLLKNTKITLYKDDLKLKNISNKTGTVQFEIECNFKYSITIEKEGYLTKTHPIKAWNKNPKYNYKAKISLKSINTPKTEALITTIPTIAVATSKPRISNDTLKNQRLIELKPFIFELNESFITKDIAIELQNVIVLMNRNQKMSIEVKSHANSLGNDSFNLILTEKRAQSIMDFIVSKGIDISRITGKGYGETELLNECANNVKCTDAQHAENKRIEIIEIYPNKIPIEK